MNIEFISPKIIKWIHSLKDPNIPGSFHLCHKGELFLPKSNEGLGFSSLAAKTAYTINAIESFSSNELHQWRHFLQSFQNNTNGLFEDIGITRDVDGLKIRNTIIQGPFKFIKNQDVRMAETRQALSALKSLGEKSLRPVLVTPTNQSTAKSLFHSLNWKNPWHSGSQLGHQLFFLKYNNEHFDILDEKNIASTYWNELSKIQSKETGAWYKGNPKSHIIVNGAMKVLISYNLYNKEIEYPNKLIDLALASISKKDGCHLLDQIYVLHSCLKQTNYRMNEIQEFANDLNNKIQIHYHEEGGFSFYPNKSQTAYYGKKVSRGLSCADMHGTHLFTWTLVLTNDIINDFKGTIWKHPLT